MTEIQPDEQRPSTPAPGEAGEVRGPNRPLRRDLAIYLLILALGMAGGGGAFLVTHAGSKSWPTTVIRTADGWRVGSPQGLTQSVVALSEQRLVWSNGGCLEVLDLASGRTTVVQRPSSDAQGLRAAVDGERLAFVDPTGDPTQGRGELIVRDLSSGRQQVVDQASDAGAGVFLSGTTAAWTVVLASPAGAGAPVLGIRAVDVITHKKTLLASGSDVSLKGLSGGAALWTSPRAGKMPGVDIMVQRVGGPPTRVATVRKPSGFALADCAIAGTWVVWQLSRVSGQGMTDDGMIVAFDLVSGRRRVVTRSTGLEGLTTDESHVAWLRLTSDAKGGAVVESYSMHSGRTTLLQPPRGWTGDLPVLGGGSVAWVVEPTGPTGPTQYVETARLRP